MTEPDVLDRLAIRAAVDRYAEAKLTRFVGLGLALAQDMGRWRRWETITKRVTLEPTGKRIHAACACMRAGARGIEPGRWHVTVCPVAGGVSEPFPVLWANPSPTMEILAELRDMPEVWD